MRLIIFILFIGSVYFSLFTAVPKYVQSDCDILLPKEVLYKYGLPWMEAPCKYQGLIWSEPVLKRFKKEEIVEKLDPKVQKLIDKGCGTYAYECYQCKTDSGEKPICTAIPKCTEPIAEPECLFYR